MISILLIANLFSVFSSFYGTVYSATMHTSFVMKTTVFGAVACVVFTPMLLPIMGVTGACVASALGQAMVFAMRVIDAKRFIQFEVGWEYLTPTLVLLITQSIFTAWEIGGWKIISGICAIIIIIIQMVHIAASLSQIREMKRKNNQ